MDDMTPVGTVGYYSAKSRWLSMARDKDISPDALAKLGAKRLAELLAEACQNDQLLRRKIEILLASKQGGEKLEGAIAKQITSLSRAHGLVELHDVPALPRTNSPVTLQLKTNC